MKRILILGTLLFLIGCDPVRDIVVEGVIYDEKNPAAIVNGDTRKVGDTIDGAKIVRISKDYVQFQYKDNIFIKKITAKRTSLFSKLFPKKSPEANKASKPNKLNQEPSIHSTNARNYYYKAKEYYSFEYYGKAVKEAQWALIEDKVTGKEREKMEQIINDCRKFMSSNERAKNKRSTVSKDKEIYGGLPYTGGTSRPSERTPDGTSYPQFDEDKKYPGGASRPQGY